MTPPEKPERGKAEAERDAERTSVIATSGTSKPDDNDDIRDAARATNGSGQSTEELELSSATPPPWQRVTQDDAAVRTEHQVWPSEETESQPETPPSSTPAEEPPAMEHPVVSGTAAPRLFGQAADAQAAAAGAAGGARTSVNIGASTQTIRTAGTTAPPSALRRPGRGPRRASLQIKRFDPWSVLKLSLVLGVALFFVWLVAVGVLYAVLDGMGVWDQLNGISSEFLQSDSGNKEPLISAGRVFGVAAIIGAINIVLFSALATVAAFVYNVSADLAGGLEVTLAERE
ncbi:transmembrane protein DUF3566 [Herbihabitans rhizosphaerae]|uniref:Transmembrane protein DUF3566 n=1 Tax=Herbihabitans rhizosphaerae TaxID=1872711 RepID=A0A4Q7KMM7_9PSEU|nr:DUF3566 domain-containing protein [Herbihabitans rhizosphaerae]RZS37574.1 transmembrane protein DUF3566 [Herbihabitans rhizosphaerae]